VGGLIIYFWKREVPDLDDHNAVFERLDEDQPVEGVAALPADEIRQRLASEYADRWDPERQKIEDEHTRVDVILGDAYVAATVFGRHGAILNPLMEIMASYGAAPYLPDDGERAADRFDAEEMEIWRFNDEEAAAAEKRHEELMDAVWNSPEADAIVKKYRRGGKKKAGCAPVLLLPLLPATAAALGLL